MIAKRKLTHFPQINLPDGGKILLVLSIVYFVLASPTMAYSGPYPEEAWAYFMWRGVTHSMICASGVVIGLVMMFLGRTRMATKA